MMTRLRVLFVLLAALSLGGCYRTGASQWPGGGWGYLLTEPSQASRPVPPSTIYACERTGFALFTLHPKHDGPAPLGGRACDNYLGLVRVQPQVSP